MTGSKNAMRFEDWIIFSYCLVIVLNVLLIRVPGIAFMLKYFPLVFFIADIQL